MNASQMRLIEPLSDWSRLISELISLFLSWFQSLLSSQSIYLSNFTVIHSLPTRSSLLLPTLIITILIITISIQSGSHSYLYPTSLLFGKSWLSPLPYPIPMHASSKGPHSKQQHHQHALPILDHPKLWSQLSIPWLARWGVDIKSFLHCKFVSRVMR